MKKIRFLIISSVIGMMAITGPLRVAWSRYARSPSTTRDVLPPASNESTPFSPLDPHDEFLDFPIDPNRLDVDHFGSTVNREPESRQALETDLSGLPTVSNSLGVMPGKNQRIDLNTCLRVSLDRNRGILAADQAIDTAYWKAKEADRDGIPTFKYEARLAPVPRDVDNAMESFFSGDISSFGSIKIEAGAALTTFGQLALGRTLGKLGISESIAKKGDTISDVATKVYQLYYGLLLANEVTDLMQRAVTAIEDNIKKAEADEYTDQVQILKFRTITFELYKQLDESKRKQELARRALRIQMGYGQESKIDFKLIPLAPFREPLKSYDTYLVRARADGSKQSMLVLGIQAKKTQYEIERRKLYPTLLWGSFFEAGYAPGVKNESESSNALDRPFNYKRAGVGLQLSGTFDWATARSKIHATESDYYKVLMQKPEAMEGIELEVREAYLDAVEKKALMERSQNGQTISRQIVFLTKSNLDIGVGEKKDYTDALQAFLLFQGRYYEAVYNYNMAFIKLKRLSGVLNDDLRLLIAGQTPLETKAPVEPSVQDMGDDVNDFPAEL